MSLQFPETESGLIDPFGRRIEYLRLSVTDQCNLRCFYCLPRKYKATEPEHWLRFDEIEQVIAAFAVLGLKRVRLTGGEPLIRKNLPQLAARLSAIEGIEDLSLSTNAVHLQKHAVALRQAGVCRLNISLDSLRPERFAQLTGGGHLDKVLAGIEAARDAGFAPIKINMVALKGINDDEFEDMVAWCLDKGFALRLIETMPMGGPGRQATDHYLSLETVRQQLERSYQLIPGVMPGGGPARYVQVAGTDLRIGFITPISQHFCETCNRVRLSADGTLYLCLGQESVYPLRSLLREGVDSERLQEAILAALRLKPERHEFREKPQQVVRFMGTTGG